LIYYGPFLDFGSRMRKAGHIEFLDYLCSTGVIFAILFFLNLKFLDNVIYSLTYSVLEKPIAEIF
jgi:hypothetical protein